MTKVLGIPLLSGRILLAAWAILILWLSLDPSPPVPENDLLSWDKLQHVAAYALLTVFAGLALSLGGTVHPRRRWVLAALAALAYGALLELLQGWCTQNRSAEFGDLLADAVGAFFVVAVALMFHHFRLATKVR